MEKIISLDSIIANKKPFYFMYNGQRYNAAFYGDQTMFKYEEIVPPTPTPPPTPVYDEPFYVDNTSDTWEYLYPNKSSFYGTNVTIEGSIDRVNWTVKATLINEDVQPITINPRTKLYLRANYWGDQSCKVTFSKGINRIATVHKIGGNIMSLVRGQYFDGTETKISTSRCFDSIFSKMEHLTSVEELILPATSLKAGCYSRMFQDCTSLVYAPITLPAVTLQQGCYSGMFTRCTSLLSGPDLLAPYLADSCYTMMFYGCSNLNYVKAMFLTDITSDERYTTYWLMNTSSTGTFVKNANATWNRTDASGTNGWTIITE